jgi:hypothetical protein
MNKPTMTTTPAEINHTRTNEHQTNIIILIIIIIIKQQR